jgi:hypothetical protein
MGTVSMIRTLVLIAGLALPAAAAPPITVFNDDGGWCWYEDERIIAGRGKLIIGSVAAGIHNPERKGDIEVAVYDLKSGAKSVHTLHRGKTPEERRRWLDDHNSPAFVVRPDGRILAMYSQHGPEEKIYYRITLRPHDPTAWGEEKIFVPSPATRVTYSNLHLLMNENGGKGRIYDFFRGLDNSFKPSWAWSDDFGETWTAGSVFINVPTQYRHRPYVKYASNGRDTVHILYTEGHPRNYDNSVYHVFYRDGKLHRSDGTAIRSLRDGLAKPEDGTLVFQGNADNVAWTSDLHIDRNGHPYGAFSVQKGESATPQKEHGDDHRYGLARWDGKKWMVREIAHAGSRLYPGEDDYTGNIALDPHDPRTVYISTNADPVTGAPLVSAADQQRHWELYRGHTSDGERWRWTALTKNSAEDNIRPIVPIWEGGRRAVLWLRGKMTAYTNYRFEIAGIVEDR